MQTSKFAWQRICYAPEGAGAGAGGDNGGNPNPAGGNNGAGNNNGAGTNGGAGQPITIAPEIGDWLKTKGFSDKVNAAMTSEPEVYKAVTSYREAEKLIGQLNSGNKIAVPADVNNLEGMREVYSKLGLPATAADYKFDVPQGGDHTFALKAGEVFHKAGLNQAQAAELNKWWNGLAQEVQTKQTTDRTARDTKQSEDLVKEWGANADTNKEVATRGGKLLAEKLGITESMQEAMADAIGVGPTTKLLHMLGDLGKVAGDTFEGSQQGSRNLTGSMTPEAAKARIELLKKDTAFQEKRAKGDAAAKTEWAQLHEVLAKGVKK